MKNIILLLSTSWFILANTVNDSAIDELKSVVGANENRQTFSLEVGMKVFNTHGKEVNDHRLILAREYGCSYTDLVKVETYSGSEGTFIVNKTARDIYFERSAMPDQNGVDALWGSLNEMTLDESVDVSMESSSDTQAKLVIDGDPEKFDHYRLVLVYDKTTKLIKNMMVYSNNLYGSTPEEKGHLVMSFEHRDLDRPIQSTYQGLLKNIQSNNLEITTGSLAGYTLKP